MSFSFFFPCGLLIKLPPHYQEWYFFYLVEDVLLQSLMHHLFLILTLHCIFFSPSCLPWVCLVGLFTLLLVLCLLAWIQSSLCQVFDFLKLECIPITWKKIKSTNFAVGEQVKKEKREWVCEVLGCQVQLCKASVKIPRQINRSTWENCPQILKQHIEPSTC